MSTLSRTLAPLSLALAAFACTRQPRAGVSSMAAAGARDSYSIYDLDATWRDARGAARPLASFRGRPVVLAMIYTHCAASCPLTLMEMKRIEAATDARVALVLVSLDPTRDTPAALAHYAADHGLASGRWALLSGTDDNVRDLAAALDVRYRHLSNDEIAHSNLVTLLDVRGDVVTQETGLRGADEIITAAHDLAR
jgi:protein SCO1